MKKLKYIGLFIADDFHQYTLECCCNGLIQAFILLTAKAINSGKHYQLHSIKNEKEDVFNVGDISKIGEIII
tara:strand:+ start:8464 stop:8679 length:216 start_codon:yes stop_codon:yes gene_type:complete